LNITNRRRIGPHSGQILGLLVYRGPPRRGWRDISAKPTSSTPVTPNSHAPAADPSSSGERIADITYRHGGRKTRNLPARWPEDAHRFASEFAAMIG
jgi:hypothetical protein